MTLEEAWKSFSKNGWPVREYPSLLDAFEAGFKAGENSCCTSSSSSGSWLPSEKSKELKDKE